MRNSHFLGLMFLAEEKTAFYISLVKNRIKVNASGTIQMEAKGPALAPFGRFSINAITIRLDILKGVGWP